jgi:hypothetical protein
VRPSGEETVQGVLSDHMIEHPLTATEDGALQKSLDLIRSISVR